MLRGLINEKLSNYKDSFADFNKALLEQPNNQMLLQLKARVLGKTEDYEQSLEIYNFLIENSSHYSLRMERAY